jgi:hypothetical protein
LTAALGVWLAGGAGPQAAVPSAEVESSDKDFDGLTSLQEAVLMTSDLTPDSDGDNVDDLVELARGSDPNNAASIPGPQTVHVGMAAREDGGVVTLVSAIYARFDQVPGVGFAMGGSYGGAEFLLPPSAVFAASTVELFPGIDPTGWIVRVETKISKSFVADYGYLGAYAVVTESGGTTPHAADVLNLFLVDSEVLALVPAPSTLTTGDSFYQPLGRGDDLPGSTWTQGEVCSQVTAVVGTDGSSVVLDVEEANCEQMASHCNAVHCAGAIGTQVKVLDAGALTGGG